MTLNGINNIYEITSSSEILKVKSFETINFDISTLIQSTIDFGKLYVGQMTTISSSDISEATITKYLMILWNFQLIKIPKF